MYWLVGIIWAVFAPVLLLIPGCALYLAAGRIRGVRTRKQRILVASAITLSVVGALWVRDSLRFDAHCGKITVAQVIEKRKVDGFFLDDSTANSFGMRYLQNEGFQWIEARSIYNRSGFTRYESSGSGISQKEVDRLTAGIAVKSEFFEDSISSTTILTVKDMQTGKLLASAGNSNFNGGAARIVLGAWGTRSCPSRWTSDGTDGFNRFYHLAKLTLG
jgi:hypothetical protein